MHKENANYFLQHLDESFDTYLEKTKCAFSGENMEIQFFLQDDIFTWKQKNILTRGEITVQPLSNILIISDILKQILERYQECQKHMVILERENGYLNQTNTKLTTVKERTVRMMEDMEKNFYRKFILLLNSKKQKIRELQKALDKKKKSIFNVATDESEESDAEDQNMQETNVMFPNTRKRKTNYQDEQKDGPKVNKNEFMRCTNFSSSRSPSPKPSTSKDEPILQDTDVQHIMKATKQFLSTPEEEPEDDLFSQ